MMCDIGIYRIIYLKSLYNFYFIAMIVVNNLGE